MVDATAFSIQLSHLAGRKNPFAEDILQVEMNGLGLISSKA
jgi:hypothetical protein